MKAAAAVCVLLSLPAWSQGVVYAVREIVPAQPKAATSASDLNDRGWVVGLTADSTVVPVNSVAFTESPSGPTVLERFLGDRVAGVHAILGDGSCVGYSGVDFFLPRAVRWNPRGAITALPAIAGQVASEATGANSKGRIVGRTTLGATVEPVLWADGVPSILPKPGGKAAGAATAINDLGSIVGYAWNWGSPQQAEGYAIDASGGVTSIGTTPSGGSTYLLDVNNAGLAVGWGGAPISGAVGIHYRDGALVTLPQFAPGSNDLLVRVNRSGVAVGCTLVGFAFRAVVTDGDRVVDLNTMLDPLTGTGWFIECATGINASGQISGFGVNPAGEDVGCVLTPVPAPPEGAAIPGPPRSRPASERGRRAEMLSALHSRQRP